MDKYIKYNSTSELHTELTNIVLLCLEEDNSYFYCYCGEEFGDCDLCDLITFLVDVYDGNSMDGLSPRKFLQKNYNNRQKLEEFSLKILPFFQKMEMNHEPCLDFFQRRYHWSSRDKSAGTTYSLSLEEVIENEKEMVDANPSLYVKKN